MTGSCFVHDIPCRCEIHLQNPPHGRFIIYDEDPALRTGRCTPPRGELCEDAPDMGRLK